jgi:hypothetical protein
LKFGLAISSCPGFVVTAFSFLDLGDGDFVGPDLVTTLQRKQDAPSGKVTM